LGILTTTPMEGGENLTRVAESVMHDMETWINDNPLRIWRKANNLTETDAAVLMGSSVGSVRNWERGAVRPRALHMANIARAMGARQSALERDWSSWYGRRPGRKEEGN
jgi:transcriptional regulator with XRE-family HTH domain